MHWWSLSEFSWPLLHSHHRLPCFLWIFKLSPGFPSTSFHQPSIVRDHTFTPTLLVFNLPNRPHHPKLSLSCHSISFLIGKLVSLNHGLFPSEIETLNHNFIFFFSTYLHWECPLTLLPRYFCCTLYISSFFMPLWDLRVRLFSFAPSNVPQSYSAQISKYLQNYLLFIFYLNIETTLC